MKLNLVRAAELRGLTMAVRWFALGWVLAARASRRRMHYLRHFPA